MEYGENEDFVARFIDFVDDHVWWADELTRTGDAAGTAT